MQTQRFSYIEIKALEDECLHLSDLTFVIGIVGDVNEVSDFWSIHFLVFGSQEHCAHTGKLKVFFGNIIDLGEIRIMITIWVK